MTDIWSVKGNEKAWVWASWFSPQKLVRLQQQTWHQQGHWTVISAAEWSFAYHAHSRTNFWCTLQCHVSGSGVNTATGQWTENSCAIPLIQSMSMWCMPERVRSPHQQERTDPYITKIFSKQFAVSAACWASRINVYYTAPDVAWHFSGTGRRNNSRKNGANMEKWHGWVG